MSNEVVSIDEHRYALNKLEVAKGLLRELDGRLSKYEALGIDELVNTLESYQEIGSIEDLNKLKAESKQMSNKKLTLAGELLRKVEQDEVAEKQLEELTPRTDEQLETEVKKDAPEDMNLGEREKVEGEDTPVEEEKDKTEKYDDSEDEDEDEDDEDEDEVSEDSSVEVKFEAAQRKLAQYAKLGTPSEIRACLGKMESLLTNHVEMADKLESYQEIGTVPELIEVCTEFATIKTKQEAARISTAFGIPVEKVTSVIEKTETIADAEKLLRDLFSKHEGEEVQVPEKQKTESAEEVEHASIIGEDKAKDKAESANLSNLAQLIKKL